MPIISKTIPNLVGMQMYYKPPEVVDPEATPIYQNWNSSIIIDEVGNRTQYDASTNPDNVLLYSWNMEYQEAVKNYFWIKNESNEEANVTMTNYTTAEYRVKDTETWTGFSGTRNRVAPGQTIEIRRAGTLMHPGIVKCNKTFSVGGDVMSLLYGENFEKTVMPTVSAGTPLLFRNLLQNNTTLIDASTLILPTQLQEQCFEDMFQGCTNLLYPPQLEATVTAKTCYVNMFDGCASLIYAPYLPATVISNSCYEHMFRGCSSLTKAPELPATTLDYECYNGMFQNCTSLTEAPELPATTMAENCYIDMFNGCTSLTEAPELPATTMAISCYARMFQGCTSLTTPPSILPVSIFPSGCCENMFLQCYSLTSAPELPATTLGGGCFHAMFKECTSLTIAPELPATTLAKSCYEQMFDSCSSLTTAPVELPATTLANSCYEEMFQNCTSLRTAPILPALTLVTSCYVQMFANCSSLNYIKAMFTTAPTLIYTSAWVYGVASSGTFVKNASATWIGLGSDGIPSGWTVQTASS